MKRGQEIASTGRQRSLPLLQHLHTSKMLRLMIVRLEQLSPYSMLRLPQSAPSSRKSYLSRLRGHAQRRL